jgi:DNA-binding MarR family transcriptional regulator
MSEPPKTPRDDRASSAFTDVVMETFRLNGRLLAAGDRLVKPISLTSARWQVMGAVRNEKSTVADIARRMGLQRQSVQRTVDVLAKEGLVHLVDNPNHRRAKFVVLTRKGWAAVRRANTLRVSWAKKSSQGITACELEIAAQVLRKIRHRLGDRSTQ